MSNLVHDDRVRGLQVKTKPSSSSGQQEDLVRRLWIVEGGEKLLSNIRFRVSIQTTELHSTIIEEVLHDIHDRGPLEEDQDLLERKTGQRGRYGHDNVSSIPTLWPVSISFGNIRSSSSNFPEDRHTFSEVPPPLLACMSISASIDGKTNGC
jgi:hypothetical protein